MQRGVLQLSKAEMSALMNSYDWTKYNGIHLVNKLNAGNQTLAEAINLEISEEELEILMDEVGVPLQNEVQELVSVRAKLSQLMVKFRNAF